ncbi:MAG: hypothetical protein HZA32_15300 [Opitutae bacterium]|nr:hypothetical protein [Opitutae bacterium]
MKNKGESLPELVRYNTVKAFLDGRGFQFFALPPWTPYSEFATKKQKLRLWTEGFQDEAFLECLSKEQASLVIDRLVAKKR